MDQLSDIYFLYSIQGKIDVDALESSNWMMGAKVVKKTGQSKQEQSPGFVLHILENVKIKSIVYI